MGAADRDPFADEEVPPQAVPANDDFVLHSQESLREMQDLLGLIHYWRTKYEVLAGEKHLRLQRWRKQKRA